jgi:hypothetical protein
MRHSKVYIVNHGDYSDNHIVGVFSSEEKAEAFRAKYEYDYLDEYKLDCMEKFIPGDPVYSVHMSLDGSSSEAYLKEPDDSIKTEFFDLINSEMYDWYKRDNKRFKCTVHAKSKEHAIKIANEKRAQYILEHDL